MVRWDFFQADSLTGRERVDVQRFAVSRSAVLVFGPDSTLQTVIGFRGGHAGVVHHVATRLLDRPEVDPDHLAKFGRGIPQPRIAVELLESEGSRVELYIQEFVRGAHRTVLRPGGTYSDRTKFLIQRHVTFEQAERFPERVRKVQAPDQGGGQVVPARLARTVQVGADPYTPGARIVEEAARADYRPVEIRLAKMVIGVSLRPVVVGNPGLAPGVRVQGAQHDEAASALDLGRHHGPDSADVIDENRLVFSGLGAGAGREDHGVRSPDCVVDEIFKIGKDGRHTQLVEHRSLSRVADHGHDGMGALFQSTNDPLAGAAVGADDEDFHE